MSAEDNISLRHNPEKQRFEAQIGDLLAVAEYRLTNQTITFTHTEVPHALEGRGIGTKLVKAALDHAREHGYRVVPRCPFVAQYIRRHPEYADLVS